MNHLVRKNKNIEGAFGWGDLNPFRAVKAIVRWGEDIIDWADDNVFNKEDSDLSDKEIESIKNRLHTPPKPETPVLKPPVINTSMAASYCFVEVIDCLSDGPIGGLVYQDINGIKIADSTDYLYSVYLDNKQVATK